MNKPTSNRSARKVQSKSTPASAGKRTKTNTKPTIPTPKRYGGSLSCDGKTRIERGDVVDFDVRNGHSDPGAVTQVIETNASQGDLIAWKTASGVVEFDHASALRVVTKAAPPHRPHLTSCDGQREISIGDLVKVESHTDDTAGIVVGTLTHDCDQGDLVIFRDAAGDYSAWYAGDIEIVKPGPLPNPPQERIFSTNGDELRAAAATFLGVKAIHDDDDNYEQATLERMRQAVHNITTSKQAIQMVESLLVTPVYFEGSIGWKWADSTAIDWASACIKALRDSLEDLEMSANCRIAAAMMADQAEGKSQGTTAPATMPATPKDESVMIAFHETDWLLRGKEHTAVRRYGACDDEVLKPKTDAEQERHNRELFELASDLSPKLGILEDFAEGTLTYCDHVRREDVHSLAVGLQHALNAMLADAIASRAANVSFAHYLKREGDKGAA